jgi:hypothetical protein
VAALYCSCEQKHQVWGSSGGSKESTIGCFSTIGNGAKPTPSASRTAPRAGSGLSARISRR